MQDEFKEKIFQANRIFTPAAPIENRDFFRGRSEAIEQVIDAIPSPGRHAIIYGKRGVGKTSLANIIDELIPNSFVVNVSANSSDDFSSLWEKILKRIKITSTSESIGFNNDSDEIEISLDQYIANGDIGIDDVLRTFDTLSQDMIIIIDEFDRIRDRGLMPLMSDTIKGFSDNIVQHTLVLVGVGDTVQELVGEHESIERNIRQIKLEKMSNSELKEILDDRLETLEMDIQQEVADSIIQLSKGFPHYTHLLGKYSTTSALKAENETILPEHFRLAVEKAVDDVEESIRQKYMNAILTAEDETLFPKVLLACAMAEEDEFGTFNNNSILEQMKKITGNDNMKRQQFTYHLGKLSSEERGNVIKKLGQEGQTRWKFTMPLMKPFILMRGISDGIIEEKDFL